MAVAANPVGASNPSSVVPVQLVRIGDPVTLALGFNPLRNNLASATAMDDKSSTTHTHDDRYVRQPRVDGIRR